MKLAASNIVWDSADVTAFFRHCADLGCSGIELAPSKIWPEPVGADKQSLASVKKELFDHGLELTGFHALLYTRRDLTLFESPASFQSTMDYLTELAMLCSDMGGNNMIMGSPANRSLCGRSFEDCFQQAVDGFGTLAENCENVGVKFCIEPLAPEQTDFISSTREGERLVEEINHPNFRLHLDATALRSETDPPELVIRRTTRPEHFHVNDPDLSPPGSSTNDLPAMIQALNDKQYHGYLSIETLNHGMPPRQTLERSVSYLRDILDRN